MHLCAFAAGKANAGCLNPSRFSKRPTSPGPPPRLPQTPSPRNPLVHSLRLKRLLTHRGGCLRSSGPPGGFLCSRHQDFPKKSPCWPPDSGLGRPGAVKAASARLAPGRARRGEGPVPSGLAQGAVPKSVLPGKRSGKQMRRAPSSPSPRPGAPGEAAVPGVGGDRTPRAARLRPGPGPGRAPGSGQERARSGRTVAPGPRAGTQAAVITWPVWFSPSPGDLAGGRGVS